MIRSVIVFCGLFVLCGCATPTALPSVGCTVEHPRDQHTVYYFTVRRDSGDLFSSSDKGRSWAHLATMPGAISDLMVHPDTGELFVILRFLVPSQGERRSVEVERTKVMMSVDGRTWRNISGPSEYFEGTASRVFADPDRPGRVTVEGGGAFPQGWKAVDSSYAKWEGFHRSRWDFARHGPLK